MIQTHQIQMHLQSQIYLIINHRTHQHLYQELSMVHYHIYLLLYHQLYLPLSLPHPPPHLDLVSG